MHLRYVLAFTMKNITLNGYIILTCNWINWTMSSTQDNGGNTFQCKIKQEAAKIQRVPKCWLSICLICHLQGVLFQRCFVFSDSQ